jgi:hypothetical protein
MNLISFSVRSEVLERRFSQVFLFYLFFLFKALISVFFFFINVFFLNGFLKPFFNFFFHNDFFNKNRFLILYSIKKIMKKFFKSL